MRKKGKGGKREGEEGGEGRREGRGRERGRGGKIRRVQPFFFFFFLSPIAVPLLCRPLTQHPRKMLLPNLPESVQNRGSFQKFMPT